MANTSSAKGNPASKRMSNPKYKAKRASNLARNENLKAKGKYHKQIREAEYQKKSLANKMFFVGRLNVDPRVSDLLHNPESTIAIRKLVKMQKDIDAGKKTRRPKPAVKACNRETNPHKWQTTVTYSDLRNDDVVEHYKCEKCGGERRRVIKIQKPVVEKNAVAS